ncbi:interferon-induced GTP-binding protein Mx [Apiospora phragmitis]|uniref:Interferon-induced GTP-binding protein Mx n=1 Tax=Apiospora phragmitis TaxID=2905665 RepID=A0ABR1USP1_9PEZI
MTREQYIKKIITLLERNRGRELPGIFNPMIVCDLLKEQSSPWVEIAERHVRKAWLAAQKFLRHSIDHIADPMAVEAIMMNVVMPKLEGITKAMGERMAKLLDHSGHPITYNLYMTDIIQKIREEREESRINSIIAVLFHTTNSGVQRLRDGCDANQVRHAFLTSADRDMDHFAASEALDYMRAYYKVIKKRFIDDLAVEAIEGCLVTKLKDNVGDPPSGPTCFGPPVNQPPDFSPPLNFC